MHINSIPEDFVVVEEALHQVGAGNYVLARLTKRNLTTERAVAILCEELAVARKDVSYAGTKDARAVTTQFITVRWIVFLNNLFL